MAVCMKKPRHKRSGCLGREESLHRRARGQMQSSKVATTGPLILPPPGWAAVRPDSADSFEGFGNPRRARPPRCLVT